MMPGHPGHGSRDSSACAARCRPISGGCLGGIAFALSLTPSLVPRTWLYQGIASGLSAATGHLIGLFLLLNWNLWCRDVIEPLWNRLTGSRRIPAVWWGRVRIALLVIIPVALLLWMIRAVRWQQYLAELMGARSYTLAQFLLVLPVGLLVWALFVAIGRAVLGLRRGAGDRRARQQLPLRSATSGVLGSRGDRHRPHRRLRAARHHPPGDGAVLLREFRAGPA
ncbi:alpha/beta-hydrolase N-terminal domain-containing protein [Corynebacterium variabile]